MTPHLINAGDTQHFFIRSSVGEGVSWGKEKRENSNDRRVMSLRGNVGLQYAISNNADIYSIELETFGKRKQTRMAKGT